MTCPFMTKFGSARGRRRELGSVGLGLYRALTEIDDPSEMAKVIVRLSAESRRVVGVGGEDRDCMDRLLPSVGNCNIG